MILYCLLPVRLCQSKTIILIVVNACVRMEHLVHGLILRIRKFQQIDRNYLKILYFVIIFGRLISNSLYSEVPGQQPWTFMGARVKPVVVEESFDVHDMEDIIRTEKWLTTEGIK